jgi:hypothetical protein
VAQFRDMATGRYVSEDVFSAFLFFDANPDAIELLMQDPSLGKALNGVAREIAKQAKALTPRNTGATVRSLRSWNAQIHEVDGVKTQAAVAGARDAIWHIIEFGSVKNPAYRPLTTAAKQVAGSGFVETSSTGTPGPMPGGE